MNSERVAPGLSVLVKLGVNLYSPTNKRADFEGILDYGHYSKTSYFKYRDGKINSITTSAAFLF